MRSREVQTGFLLTGNNLISLVVSLVAVAGMCIANFSMRWTLWCNVAEKPMAEAAVNVALIVAAALVAALALTGMLNPRQLWRVPLVYGAFFLCLPTAMFFSEYLAANLLVVMSMYNVMRLQGNPGEEKAHLFFASFFLVMAVWFVPSTVVFLAALYAGVLLFAPSDLRNWLIPFAGIGASYILLVTYETAVEGEVSFFPEVSRRLFDMPYTEKVFKSANFYFYAACLLLIGFVAYVKCWGFVAGETVPRKKRFLAVSAMGLCAGAMMALWPSFRYMAVFFSLPFTALTVQALTLEGSRLPRSLVRWGLVILAGLGLLFFR